MSAPTDTTVDAGPADWGGRTAELPRLRRTSRVSHWEVPSRPESPRRVRRPSRDALLVTGLVAVVLTVLAWNITGFPTASDDEGTYLAQAWAVRHGVGLAHYTYWYDHPPLAWIQLAALSWLPGALLPTTLAVAAGRLAMLPVAGVSLGLVYLFCRRLGLGRGIAAGALLLYGLSPLSVTMMRQLYLDSFAVMWILVALVLALSPRRHLWHHVLAGVAAAIAVLSKETMLVVVPAVVLALWQSTARTPVRPWALAGFGSGLVLTGCFYPLFAALKGELLAGAGHVSLLGALRFQLSRTGSGSVFTPGSGANQLVHAWLYYDHVLLLGGLVAAGFALGVRRLRVPAVATVTLALVALRPGGYLPAMYVVQLLPFLAVLLAASLDLVASGRYGGRHRPAPTPASARSARRRLIAAGALAVVGLGYLAPQWIAGDRRAMTDDANAAYAATAAWLRHGLADPRTVVVVDDVLWNDLVAGGRSPDTVLWFYKVDLDPAVAARLPRGWRSVDYIVSTPAVRQDTATLPTIGTLLSRSTVVAAFGPDDGRIEIRRVNQEEP